MDRMNNGTEIGKYDGSSVWIRVKCIKECNRRDGEGQIGLEK